ncbi:MAG: hypothetical protein Q8R00_03655 [Candidatus Nanoarchaeia archaeon]|nr:hypothetical protein [Candidatus Nanoarchaeia archaeon]
MAINLTPSAIIGIILGVIITLASLAIGMGFMGLFEFVVDEGSVNNFHGLWAAVGALIEKAEPFISNLENPRAFYLQDGLILVGYNHNRDLEVTMCTGEPATKPPQLFGKAGLCLHTATKAGGDFDRDQHPPEDCLDFDEKIIFLAPSDDSMQGGFAGAKMSVKHPLTGNQEYEALFLYGSECDIGEPDLGSTRLYLEVFKGEDAIYVYINEHATNEQIKANIERYSKLKAELV